MRKKLLSSALTTMALAVVAFNANAQCTTWVNPSATGGWSDFNTAFGGAPCDDGTGCPINEITDFEIWADEAYAMDNVNQGGTYTFSACNGTGGTAWPLELTVVAPSGAVDAHGLDNGSTCALTFTASESGTYLIVVSEAGACGASSNQDVDNGFPAFTCVSGPQTQCPPPQPGCTDWVNPSASGGWSDFNTAFGGAPCDSTGAGCPFNEITDFEVFADEAYAMDNVNVGSTYTFSACNGVGGTAWPLEFTVVAPSGTVDAFGLDNGSTCALTFTASESGTYLIVVSEAGACGASANQAVDNGFPAITCNTGTPCSSIGIPETTIAHGMVYPNPTSGSFSLVLPRMAKGLANVAVIDASGREVKNMTVSAGTPGPLNMDLSAAQPGAYVVRVTTNGLVSEERIMIVRN